MGKKVRKIKKRLKVVLDDEKWLLRGVLGESLRS